MTPKSQRSSWPTPTSLVTGESWPFGGSLLPSPATRRAMLGCAGRQRPLLSLLWGPAVPAARLPWPCRAEGDREGSPCASVRAGGPALSLAAGAAGAPLGPGLCWGAVPPGQEGGGWAGLDRAELPWARLGTRCGSAVLLLWLAGCWAAS